MTTVNYDTLKINILLDALISIILSKWITEMKTWIILCASCLLALLYPCSELTCWDTAGNRNGSWAEISCDGNSYSGTWTAYITNDCRFFGTNEWESVSGTINPSTKVLTATGMSHGRCGSIEMTGSFTTDLVSVSGSYKYSKGGSGSFKGNIQSTSNL